MYDRVNVQKHKKKSYRFCTTFVSNFFTSINYYANAVDRKAVNEFWGTFDMENVKYNTFFCVFVPNY